MIRQITMWNICVAIIEITSSNWQNCRKDGVARVYFFINIFTFQELLLCVFWPAGVLEMSWLMRYLSHHFKSFYPSRQNRLKVTLEEGFFIESAFNMRCHIVKNTLLQVAFSAILPAGILPEPLRLRAKKGSAVVLKIYCAYNIIKIENT